MSTDYQVWCTQCMVSMHLGQSMGGSYSFGFGTGDSKQQAIVMEFIALHAAHEIKDMMGNYIDTDHTLHLRIGFDAPNGYVRMDDLEDHGRI